MKYLFFNRSGRQHYLTLREINDDGESITLIFDRSKELCFKPGQYLSIYPFSVIPNFIQTPLNLVISSGINDKTLDVTFRKSSYLLTKKTLLQQFQIGAQVYFDGPFGNGFDVIADTANPVLVIAAGSSISLAHSVMQSMDEKESVSIIYSAKRINNIPYFDELCDLADDTKNYLTLTEESHLVPKNWHEGRITEHLKSRKIPDNTTILICGPDAFIKETAQILQEKEHPLERIYVSSNVVRKSDNNIIFNLKDEKAKDLLISEEHKLKKKLC